MKIKSENFLTSLKNNNNSNKILLLYGPNSGLINLLYKKSISILSIDINDPFNVSKIDGIQFKDNPSLLNDSISTFSMSKEKRTVLLDLTYVKINKNIENTILSSLNESINDYFLLIKANNLGSKNQLVKFVENIKNGILVPCYDEDTNKVKIQILKLFNKYGFKFSDDFVSMLSTKFNSDSAINLMEIKKLETFLIDNQNITEELIISLITDNININQNKIIQLSLSGKIEEALLSLDKIYENSSTAISITRSFVIHFKTLEKILLAVENGFSISESINNIKPPIFFKDKPLLIFQCQLWSLKTINLIFKRLIDIEIKLKSNLYPSKVLLSQFILSTSLIAKKSAKI
ncbi:DNA polymerase III subunit delta [Alphaproteobacteria bacterium]|nr:DNA polymerase III subunit delta [Alphaproteobacteria bacterium]